MFYYSKYKNCFFLKEEKRNNLIQLKFIYYLMINDQLNYKLNNHNYKIYKIIVKLLHYIFIRIVHPLAFLFFLIIFTFISIISRSFVLIILLQFNFFIIYICSTSLIGILPLIYSMLVYYILRFNQINTQLRLFHKIKIISLQTINKTMNEHNQLPLAIHQLNLTLNKTIGWLFIITAIVIDSLIYMLIYTKSIYYKLVFLLLFLDVLLEHLSSIIYVIY